MPFLIYIAIAFVTVFGVLVEMDVLVEPSRHIERAASEASAIAPVGAAGVGYSSASQEAAPKPVASEAKKAEANPPAVLAKPATAKVVDTPAAPTVNDAAAANASVPLGPSIAAPAPSIAAQEPAPKCDVAACEAAYFTFTPSDCTYQPSNGPRRLCTKGTPPGTSAERRRLDTGSAVAAQASAKCNQTACAQAYFTFNPADCTYQPNYGPRRLCTK